MSGIQEAPLTLPAGLVPEIAPGVEEASVDSQGLPRLQHRQLLGPLVGLSAAGHTHQLGLTLNLHQLALGIMLLLAAQSQIGIQAAAVGVGQHGIHRIGFL